MGEMERRVQRRWWGLELDIPVPCMVRVPTCDGESSTMQPSSTFDEAL